MWKEKRQKFVLTVIMAVAVFFFCQERVLATEGMVTLPVPEGEDVVTIQLPVITEYEESPFDFIMDPHGLLYDTDAAHYGVGAVEPGATLLFHNQEGEYDFSKYSDQLTIINQCAVPVRVTISARFTGLEGVKLVETPDFSGIEEPCVYFAIVDDKGNVSPLFVDGETSICFEMGFDTYNFGLTGECNPNGNWQGIESSHPTITVTWRVEPVVTESEDIESIEEVEETEATEETVEPIIETTVSGNDSMGYLTGETESSDQ